MNLKDLLAGGFFLLFGAAYVAQAYATLPVGTGARMGPGFFPIVLGGGLVLLGAVITLRSFWNSASALGVIPLRAVVLLPLSAVLFGVAIRTLGFVPATALAVFTAALASRHVTVGFAAVLAAALTLFCGLIFLVALNLPLPVFMGWYITR